MNIAHALDRSLYFVRESTGPFRASYDYDIYDPRTDEKILECREQNLGRLTKLFRFSDLRRTTPFDFAVRTPDGQPVIRVARGVALFTSRTRVYDADNQPVGGFALKPFSVSGAFDVLDAIGLPVCGLKGNLTGWSFRFLTPDGVELARVMKKWAGAGKELVAGASDYLLQIDDAVPPGSVTRQLILASVLCIGMVLRIQT